MPAVVEYSLAVTSCGRQELLRQTLESFCACVDVLPAMTVVAEDGPQGPSAWFWELPLGTRVWRPVSRREGQGVTIDRAYALVDSELLFHLEDDWLFLRRGPIIEESARILATEPQVSAVMLTGQPCWAVRDPRFSFLLHRPSATGLNPAYDGISFNPGLRRVSDYRALGVKFADYEKGMDIENMDCSVVEFYAAAEYAKRGFLMASLGENYVAHTGERSAYLHGRKP